MSFAVPSSPVKNGIETPRPAAPGTLSKKEAEIIVIPSKFYGVALNMKVAPVTVSPELPPVKPTPPKPVPTTVPPPRGSSQGLKIALAVFACLFVVTAGFVYFNRDLLFKKPVVPQVVIKPIPPVAPTNLVATSTGPTSVALHWIDAGSKETGYRVERRDADVFSPLTNLPPNSSAFLDVSAQPGKTYSYRVFALNEAGDSLSSNEVLIALPSLPPPPVVAPTIPPDGLDSDSDGLTDVEERMWGTNPFKPDTGGQGFLDGNALFNLYSPTSKSPTTLLGAGSVTVVSSTVGWSLWLPNSWTLTRDVADGSHVTITAPSRAETFVLSVEDNSTHLSLTDWVYAHTPSLSGQPLVSIHTKGAATIETPAAQRTSLLDGVYTPDRLTAFFLWGNKVLVFRYQLNSQSFVYFRTTFGMMLNSLLLSPLPNVTALPPATNAVSSSSASTTSAASIAATSTPTIFPVSVSSTSVVVPSSASSLQGLSTSSSSASTSSR